MKQAAGLAVSTASSHRLILWPIFRIVQLTAADSGEPNSATFNPHEKSSEAPALRAHSSISGANVMAMGAAVLRVGY